MTTSQNIDPRILERIPHRPPFLWLDRIIELQETSIRAEKRIPEDLPLFAGHYPDYPLMPGVLLCEAVFQAGALLIGETLDRHADADTNTNTKKLPVLTRILGAKFKREVRPGDLVEISAELSEQIGPAWLMRGKVKVEGKVAVQVEFACASKES